MRKLTIIIVSLALMAGTAFGQRAIEFPDVKVRNSLQGVYYADPFESNQGVDASSGGDTIKSYLDVIGNSQATIALSHFDQDDKTVYSLDSDLTIPSNVTLKIERGAVIETVTGDETLTFGAGAGIEAGLYQIWGDNLSLGGNPAIDYIYPQWRGAVADTDLSSPSSGTDCTTAFTKTLTDWREFQKPIRLPQGVYRVTGEITTESTDHGLAIIGDVPKQTRSTTSGEQYGASIIYKDFDNDWIFDLAGASGSLLKDVVFQDITFAGGDTGILSSFPTAGFVRMQYVNRPHFRGVGAKNMRYTAFSVSGFYDVEFHDCFISGCGDNSSTGNADLPAVMLTSKADMSSNNVVVMNSRIARNWGHGLKIDEDAGSGTLQLIKIGTTKFHGRLPTDTGGQVSLPLLELDTCRYIYEDQLSFVFSGSDAQKITDTTRLYADQFYYPSTNDGYQINCQGNSTINLVSGWLDTSADSGYDLYVSANSIVKVGVGVLTDRIMDNTQDGSTEIVNANIASGGEVISLTAADNWDSLYAHSVISLIRDTQYANALQIFLDGDDYPRLRLKGREFAFGTGGGVPNAGFEYTGAATAPNIKVMDTIQFPAVTAGDVANNCLFLDTADSVLKFKDSSGTVHSLW